MTRINIRQTRLKCPSCKQHQLERQEPNLTAPMLERGMTWMVCRRCGHREAMQTADWRETQTEGAQAA